MVLFYLCILILKGQRKHAVTSTYLWRKARLKVTLKDTSIVNKEGIQKLGAKGIVEIDNELKIILGPNSKQLKKYMADLKK